MKRRILLVDDDISQLSLLADRLTLSGFNIDTVKEGKIALAEIKSKQFDLLITDLNMPEMDGISLLNEARKIKNEIPVILLTGLNDNQFIMKALNAGFDGFFIKPFNMDALIAKIKGCIVKKKMSDILLQEAKMSGLGELTA